MGDQYAAAGDYTVRKLMVVVITGQMLRKSATFDRIFHVFCCVIYANLIDNVSVARRKKPAFRHDYKRFGHE